MNKIQEWSKIAKKIKKNVYESKNLIHLFYGENGSRKNKNIQWTYKNGKKFDFY